MVGKHKNKEELIDDETKNIKEVLNVSVWSV